MKASRFGQEQQSFPPCRISRLIIAAACVTLKDLKVPRKTNHQEALNFKNLRILLMRMLCRILSQIRFFLFPLLSGFFTWTHLLFKNASNLYPHPPFPILNKQCDIVQLELLLFPNWCPKFTYLGSGQEKRGDLLKVLTTQW